MVSLRNIKSIVFLLSFLFLSYSSKADTIDFWQLRSGDHILLQGFCGSKDTSGIQSLKIDSAFRKLNSNPLNLFYGGCQIPTTLFVKLVAADGQDDLSFSLNARHGGFNLPYEIFPRKGKWIVYILPDRSADRIEWYFPAFRVIIT
jgi:hypothetical protein